MAKILIRRMSDAARLALSPVPAAGEPIWCTDTKKLYVGDAVTAGGIPVDTVGGPTSNCILVTSPIITGSATANPGTSVSLSASGSHSALEDDNRVSIAKYTWTKPDGTTVDGVGLTVTANATTGGTVTVKCRATDTLGNVSADTTLIITSIANTLPSTPTVVSDFPINIVRGDTYTIKVTATDADGDNCTFNLINLVGCSAGQLTGITAAAGVVVTVDPQADQVSVGFKSVDSKGGQSVGTLTLIRNGTNIVNPTGTTVFLTPGQTHVISVPDWADVATFTGNGGAGTSACANGQYHIGANRRAWSLVTSGGSLSFFTAAGAQLSSPDPDYPESTTNTNGCWRLRAAYNSAVTATYTDTAGTGQLASSNFTAMGTSTPSTANVDASAGNPGNSYITPQTIIHKTLGTLYPSSLQYVGAASTTASGVDTTVTGAVSATFAGAASGVTAAPTQTTQIKTLTSGSNRSITVTIPATGSCKVDWS